MAAKFLKAAAPDAASRMSLHNECSKFSSYGLFTGCTVVADFSCHPHKDQRNLSGAATVVVSLTSSKADNNNDSQLHILHSYKGPESGDSGIAFKMPSGSAIVEVSKAELHSTTKVAHPDSAHPSRIGLVFYRHLGLDQANHGSKVR